MDNLVNNKKNHAIILIIVIAMLSLTVFFLLRGNHLPELWSIIKGADVRFLLLGVGIMVAFFAMEAGSMRVLLGSLGYKVPFKRCYGYSLVDFYFSAITPGCCGGQPSQIYYMQRDGIPVGSSSLSLLMFNTAYHLAVLAVMGVVLVTGGMQLIAGMGIMKYFLIYGGLMQLGLVVLYLATAFSSRLVPSLVHHVIEFLVKIHIVRDGEKMHVKAEEQLGEYRCSSFYIRQHPLVLLKVLGMAIVHIVALYAIPFCVYKALGLSGYSILQIIAVQAAMTLAIESLPIPGGIGVTESSFLVVYGTIFGPQLVLPALLLCRGFNYYCCLAVGGVTSAVMQGYKPLKIARN